MVLFAVKPRVSLISSPQPVIRKGQSLHLICQDESDVIGNITLFSWTHNGQILPNYTNSLLFRNADAEVAGEYKCNASNEAGEDYDSIKVIVTCKCAKKKLFVILSCTHDII